MAVFEGIWALNLDKAQARPPGESQKPKTKMKRKRQMNNSKLKTDENPVGGMKRGLDSMDIFLTLGLFFCRYLFGYSENERDNEKPKLRKQETKWEIKSWEGLWVVGEVK